MGGESRGGVDLPVCCGGGSKQQHFLKRTNICFLLRASGRENPTTRDEFVRCPRCARISRPSSAEHLVRGIPASRARSVGARPRPWSAPSSFLRHARSVVLALRWLLSQLIVGSQFRVREEVGRSRESCLTCLPARLPAHLCDVTHVRWDICIDAPWAGKLRPICLALSLQ